MRTAFILFTAMALLLSGVVFSGEMGDMKHGEYDKKASKTEKSEMQHGMMMMKDMNHHADEMMSQLNQMREHVEKMQELENLSDLHKELDKHQSMMMKLHDQMARHQNMTDSVATAYGMAPHEKK